MTSNDTTLLIVDDHPLFRAGLKAALADIEALRVVAEAEDGDTALALIGQLEPDLVMLDLALPGQDGLSVLENARARNLASRFIVVTSYDDPAYLDRALALGAVGYLLKDSADSDIRSCLTHVRQGQHYVSPAFGQHKPLRPLALQPSLLHTLTAAEKRILHRVAQFKTSKEIATELGISVRTVQNHRANICAKLKLHGPHQLLGFAREHLDEL